MCAMGVISLLYMVNMLTITRIHYSIDIIGGLIFALFWYEGVVKKQLPKFDYFFSGLYYLGRKIRAIYKRKRATSSV